MTAEIIRITPDPGLVDSAWSDLRQHRARILDDPKCLLDRSFVEEDARLEDRFKRLYLRGCR
jgi:hypothetical protein